MPTLYHIFGTDDHVVTQVIKAHFVVCAIGHVGGVGFSALCVVHVMQDHTHRHAHETKDVFHPFALEFGKVIIDGDDVHAVACKGVEVGGQGCGMRFAFTCFHLRNAPLMKADTAHDLHGEEFLAIHAPHGFAKGGEGIGEDVIEGFALLQAFFEFGGFVLQRLIGQLTVGFFFV